ERVTGVQTQPGPRMPVQRGQVWPEVPGRDTEHPALAGGRFKQKVRPIVAERVEQREQAFADTEHALLAARVHRRTGVDNNAPCADLTPTTERMRQRRGRSPPRRRVR